MINLNKPLFGKNHLSIHAFLLFVLGFIPPAVSYLAANPFYPSGSTPASDSNKVKIPKSGAVEHYFLADRNSSLIHTLNVADNIQVGTARAGTHPDGIAISPNGRLAFVANLNANFISVIDLTLNAEIRRLKDLRARTVALNADGTRLVAPMINNRMPDEVVIIDTSTLTVIQRVSLNGLLGDDPADRFDISLGPMVIVGNRAYIENASSFPIAVVDINTFAVSTVPGSNVGFPLLFSAPSIAATPSGNHVVVLKQGPNALLIIDTGTNTVVQNTALPSTPNTIAVTREPADPDGIFGYLARTSNQISAVNLNPASPNFGQIVSSAALPTGFGSSVKVELTADSNRAYVVSSSTTSTNNVGIIDTGLLITNPATALINQFRVGARLTGLAVGVTETMPPAGAPIVTTVAPNIVLNAAPTTIEISGSGFVAGAFVRFGNLDPVSTTLISPNLIEAVVPQNAAAQIADIIVTNPNSTGPVSQHHLSGRLSGQLTITNPANFQPTNRVVTNNFGESTLSILNLATTLTQASPVGTELMGLAFTPDGQRVYVEQFSPGFVRVFNLTTGLVEANIAVGNTTLGQTDGIAVAPNPTSGKPVALVVAGVQTGANIDERLFAIDADPTSPTFNTVIDTLNAGLTNASFIRGALAVTPNGRYVYSQGFGPPDGRLIIFDRVGRTVTILSLTGLGVNIFQSHIHVTPDGQSLLMGDNGNIKVFDIGVNPLNPTLVTTIVGITPGELEPVFLDRFQVETNRLFAYDSSQHVVEVFNFNRAASDFSVLGTLTIPGTADLFSCGFGVLPGGAFIYATLRDDACMAVVDTAKLIAGNPGALITKIATGLSPHALAVSPRPVADLSLSSTASPSTVANGSNITYSFTITNTGLDTAQSIMLTDSLPSEVSFVSCNSTGSGVCGGSGNNRSVTFSTLAPGELATVNIVASVNCSVPNGSLFNNSATISSLTPDTNISNNSSTTNSTALNLIIAPTNQSFSARGGSSIIDIISPCGTNWTATSNDSWIVIVSSDSGAGSGAVGIEVRENSDQASRTGTLIIGGRTYTVLQGGTTAQGCVNSISPLFSSFSAIGGTGTVNITAQAGCIWATSSNVDWITITSNNSGTGNGSINYSVSANTSGSARKGSIKISGQTLNVKQKGN